MKRAIRQVFRSILTSLVKIFEGICEWIDAKKSRKKVYRIVTLAIAEFLICSYAVVSATVLWQAALRRSLTWQMLEPMPLVFATHFFIALSGLFDPPDDGRDPPPAPICPWPSFPEDNRPELVLMFECKLEGQKTLVKQP
jgi:hypothetical protein